MMDLYEQPIHHCFFSFGLLKFFLVICNHDNVFGGLVYFSLNVSSRYWKINLRNYIVKVE